MCVKLPPGDSNTGPCPPHSTSTYTCGVTISPRVCSDLIQGSHSPSLQLAIITSLPFYFPLYFISISTMSFASSSIKILAKFNSMYKLISSRSSHNFAATLVVCPIALAQPFAQSPLEFQIIPPQPTVPRLPKEKSLEFNLYQFSKGWYYYT